MVKQSLRPNAKVKQCLIQSMTTGLLLLLFTAEVVMFFAEMPVWLHIFLFGLHRLTCLQIGDMEHQLCYIYMI